jgi:hypothetical protein
MKAYGLDLTGSSTNASGTETGVSFPSSPAVGQVFFLTTTVGAHLPGLYVYNGTSWITGDISSITVGSGLTGGGQSGDVSIGVDTGIVLTRDTITSSDITNTLGYMPIRPITQVEIDFGNVATKATKSFVVTDSNVTASYKIIANQSADAPTGKFSDDNEFDQLQVSATAGNGSITIFVTPLSGMVIGKFKINYIIG